MTCKLHVKPRDKVLIQRDDAAYEKSDRWQEPRAARSLSYVKSGDKCGKGNEDEREARGCMRLDKAKAEKRFVIFGERACRRKEHKVTAPKGEGKQDNEHGAECGGTASHELDEHKNAKRRKEVRPVVGIEIEKDTDRASLQDK